MKPVYILVGLVAVIFAISSAAARGDPSYVPQAFMLGLAAGAVYFIPSFIAFSKNHPSKTPILTLNALGGWLVIGWLVAIVWAVMDKKSGTTSNPATTASSAKPPEVAVGSADITAQLTKLNDLRQQGALTDDEYQSAKAKLLS